MGEYGGQMQDLALTDPAPPAGAGVSPLGGTQPAFGRLGLAERRGAERSSWGDGWGERFPIRLGLKCSLSLPCLLQGNLLTQSPRAGGCHWVGPHVGASLHPSHSVVLSPRSLLALPCSGCSSETGKLASLARSGPCFGLAQAFVHPLGTRTHIPGAGPCVCGLVKLEGCARGFEAHEGAGSTWTASSLPEPHMGRGCPIIGGLGGSDSAGRSSEEARSGNPSQAARRRRRAPGILMTSSAPSFLLLRSLEVP